MANEATISFRTDPRVKRQAKELFESMGLDLSTALNMFLRQSLFDNGMPFRATREHPLNTETRRQADVREGEVFATVGCLDS